MTEATPHTGGLKGVHVLTWLLGMFFVMIAVNTVFVVSAVLTFPGEQVRNSYVLGLDYNREVERRREQEKLGWRAEAGVSAAGDSEVVVRMRSVDGAPLSGLSLAAELHVAGEAGTTRLVLREGHAGEYAAKAAIPPGARLDMQIEVRRSDDADIVFRAYKELSTP